MENTITNIFERLAKGETILRQDSEAYRMRRLTLQNEIISTDEQVV